jgi:hypothetical protein
MYGNPVIALNDNGNTIDQWVTATGWGTSSTVYHTPTSSITDSPTGNYANNASTSITTKSEIDLSDANNSLLTFWGKWNVEQGFDYVQLAASIDQGQNWIPLCGKYTSTGNSKQDAGNPVYDGIYDWVKEEVSLNAFNGKKILLRFSLKSDGQNIADGFYFDDLLVEKITSNTNSIKETDATKAFAAAALPNPADAFTNITFKVDNSIAGDSKLIIYNALGQEFYSEKVNTQAGNISLDTSKWPDGIYYYSLQKGKYTSEVNKLCITH